MFTIDYKEYNHKIKGDKEAPYIFDSIRKKWLLLTPEEWVRQNFIQYLIQEKSYPKTIIAVEKLVKLPEVRKRFDIVVYNSLHQPYILIECKRQTEALNEKVWEQILHYQTAVKATYLFITNGHQVMGYHITSSQVLELADLPNYQAV
jgi:hypothetical protein